MAAKVISLSLSIGGQNSLDHKADSHVNVPSIVPICLASSRRTACLLALLLAPPHFNRL